MLLKICFVIFACLFSSVNVLLFAKTNVEWGNSMISREIGYRLPNNTIPKLYSIQIEPHIDDLDFTFNGTSTIYFEVIRPTQDVIVQASELIKIEKSYTKLVHENGTTWKPISQQWYPILEFFFVRFESALPIGNYTLEFKWLGQDSKYADGVFRFEDSKADNNSSSYVVATHFQATSARSAFPCWDEPGFRAQFDISIKHFPNYTSLSNMPLKNQAEAEDGKIWTNFERSPSMPTYLVTFILSDYEHYVNQDGNITFYAPKGNLRNVEYAFNLSQLIVPAFEEYTGISYTFPKLDQITMKYYPSGATEHWGMITYGAHSVEYDPESEEIPFKDLVALITAHEIAHQWFGNLVTPAWWDDVWLSEAFAVYFSHKILDKALDNQHFMETFVGSTVNMVSFEAEIKNSPRPIKFHSESPTEVENLFTRVTYRKGAAVIFMLENILSEEVFRSGISKYLQKHQMSTVTTDDLWKALQEAYEEKGMQPNLKIKEIMDPWINQTGYPMLNVTREYKTGFTNISQINALNFESNNSWMIPVNFVTSSNINFNSTKPMYWMNRSNKSLPLYGIDRDDWLILNIQQTGFYRVNYDYENWKRLADYLNTENYYKIHVNNRAQLIWDLQYFNSIEPQYFELLIDVMSYLHREVNYLPWMPAVKLIENLLPQLAYTPVFDVFQKFFLHLMNNIIDHIGNADNENNDRLVTLGKYHLLPLACHFGHTGCRNAARSELVARLQNGTIHEFSSRSKIKIYCCGLKNSNDSVWENFMSSFMENPSRLSYFGCSENYALKKKYLDLIFVENSTLESYYVYEAWVSASTGNRQSVDFGLNYLVDHIDQIRQYFDSTNNPEYILRMIEKIGKSIKTNDQFEKFRRFLEKEEKDGKMTPTAKLIDSAQKSLEEDQRGCALFQNLIDKKPYLANFISDQKKTYD